MKEILNLLPTKVSKFTILWMIPAAAGGFFIVGYLKPLLSFWQDETITILQVAVFLFVVLIGTLIIIISLIHHIKNRDVKVIINHSDLENNKEPSVIAKSILMYCIENDKTSMFSEDVIRDLQHSRIQIESAFEELEELNLIDSASYLATGIEYVLTSRGKTHVLNMGK